MKPNLLLSLFLFACSLCPYIPRPCLSMKDGFCASPTGPTVVRRSKTILRAPSSLIPIPESLFIGVSREAATWT